MSDLLKSKAFWAAVILLAGALANWLIPNVPKDVITEFLALLGVIAAVLAGQSVVEARKARGLK